MLFNIIIATVAVSAIALIGIVLFFFKNNFLTNLKPLISLAAGSLLTVALIDLLPEALHGSQLSTSSMLMIVLASILLFFIIERIFHWHHCSCAHHEHETAHNHHNNALAFNNLVGDAIHNLIDGFLIAATFLISPGLGIATTIAIILHEIPQEIADFGILLHAGMSKKKALFYNIAIAFLAVLGAILFYYFGQTIENAIPIMAAFAAGNFLYLSMADLIPELHHETKQSNVIKHTVWLLIGVILMTTLINLTPHEHGTDHDDDNHNDEITVLYNVTE